MQFYELRQNQSLPLKLKIRKSQLRIREWYDHWDGDVYEPYCSYKLTPFKTAERLRPLEPLRSDYAPLICRHFMASASTRRPSTRWVARKPTWPVAA